MNGIVVELRRLTKQNNYMNTIYIAIEMSSDHKLFVEVLVASRALFSSLGLYLSATHTQKHMHIYEYV